MKSLKHRLFLIPLFIFCVSLIPQLASAEGNISITDNAKVKVFSDKYTTFNLKYPTIPDSVTNAAGFNQLINQYVENASQNFLKNLEPIDKLPKNTGMPLNNESNTLYITYKVVNSSNQIISVILTTTTNYYLMAHPSPSSQSINFDLKSGKPIVLSDLFLPKSNYLEALSDYCLAKLKTMPAVSVYSDRDWIRIGSAPSAKNYSIWNISPNGLQITFDVYQVAAYVSGPQQVLVPYNALSSVINKDSVLNRFSLN